MRVVRQFGSYNERRYGRPWIAKITAWPIGKRPEIEFGHTTGLMAEIDAEPGAIIRWGQRDHRGRGTDNEWSIVRADGSFVPTDPATAREHWLAGCPVPAGETDNVVPFNRAED